MSVVSDYWVGVLQRLEAEVSVFSQLVLHHGEKGRENEAVLARILQALVPQRYGIGSGLVIDSARNYSKQTDIIVFEQSDEPSLMAQTTQLLFPVENVVAAIEVKTTLRDSDITDCCEKAASLRRLSPAREYPDKSTHPPFFVLAYASGSSPAKVAERFRDAPPGDRPDMVCVISPALLVGRPSLVQRVDHNDESMVAGIALLTTDTGARIEGAASGPDMRAVHEGRQYPLVRVDDQLVLADPARALLLFVDGLLRSIALQQARRAPVLTHYIEKNMRTLAWLD